MWLNERSTILIAIPAMLVVAVVAARRRYGFWKTLSLLAGVAYLHVLVTLTQFPFPLTLGSYDVGYEPNWVPLQGIMAVVESCRVSGMWSVLIRQVAGNVLLFVPLGFFLPLMWERFERLGGFLLVALLAPVATELVQMLNGMRVGMFYRVVDIDDVILNIVGCLLGYLLYRALRRVGFPLLKLVRN